MKKIIILCTGNSCRSQMAHGFLENMLNNYSVYSAGTKPEPVNKYAVKVMSELEIDISNYASNHIDEYLEHHENKAIDCALDIQKNMEELNKELHLQGIEPVAIGIGINTGYAVIGNMGSEERFDYTGIGDAVNTAARLESGTKEAGVDLLIGYNTAIKSDYKLRLLEPLKVKGKEEPLQVYTWE